MPPVGLDAPASTTALLALVISVLSPILLAWLTGKQRRQEKKEEAEAAVFAKQEEARIPREEKEQDWARQDKVAAEVKEVARLAKEEAARVAAELDSKEQSI